MGVKGLWSILEPVCEECPLSELAERSVAIDLSGWVVEAEKTTALARSVHQSYLRNLVYRTSALLLQHTLPVFVLDGAAPALKLQELARRQGRPLASCGRQQLRGRLQRCARLLDALGVPHLPADGEAEALCARLDAEQLVDGVVSDDGDAALHGARTLYRHLSAGQSGGQVTRCCMGRARQQLGLEPAQLRELALLLGCDYLPGGLPGLGLQTALLLLQRLAGRPLLPQLAQWLREPPLSELRAVGELGRAPSHCAACLHPGTETQHRRAGCAACGAGDGCIAAPADPAAAACPCDWHRQRRAAELHAPELKARDCARRCPEFESRAAQALAELTRTPPLPEHRLSWRRPDVAAFVAEAGRELGWQPAQSWQLVAPLLARWQLRHGDAAAAGPLRPLQVQRTSRHLHVNCYLVSWQMTLDGQQLDATTHEPRPLLEAAHRQLVDAFLETKKRPRPAPARSPRKPKNAGDLVPKARSGVSGSSRLITDFFPTKKRAAQQVAGRPAVRTGKTKGPGAEAVAVPPPQTLAEKSESTAAAADVRPRLTTNRRAGSDSDASPSLTPGSPEPPRASADSGRPRVSRPDRSDSAAAPRRTAPKSDAAGEAADSDSESAGEAADSDGSVADLSAIIDAITRTHISQRDVIVISDDDDDSVGEVAAVSGAGRRDVTAARADPRSVGDAADPEKSTGTGVVPVTVSASSCSAAAAVPRRPAPPGSGRCPPPPPAGDLNYQYAAGATAAVTVAATAPHAAASVKSESASDSDSDSDDQEYVPLHRRLAMRQ